MRRIPLILGLVLITGLIIHDIYEFFVTNEGIRYFSSEPRRLLYVMLLGVVGGLVAFRISRLSPASQRSLKLLALGGFGTLLVVAVAFFGYLFYRLAVAGLQDGLGWVWTAWAVAFVPMTLAASMVWMEFRQVWRQTR
jgi:hypothetical protein